MLVRRLNTTPQTMRPVLERSGACLAQRQRYAYEQLVLLAFLALTRKVKVVPILAVAAPRTRGRGVHPHSLQAVEMARHPTGFPEAALEAAAEAVTPGELDGLIETYFKEAAEQRPAPPAKAGPDSALDAAVDRFARAYYAATAAEAQEAVSFALTGPLLHLFRTASDFVIPGDLLHTNSLVTMGEVR